MCEEREQAAPADHDWLANEAENNTTDDYDDIEKVQNGTPA